MARDNEPLQVAAGVRRQRFRASKVCGEVNLCSTHMPLGCVCAVEVAADLGHASLRFNFTARGGEMKTPSDDDMRALVLTDVSPGEYAQHNYVPLLLEHYRARASSRGVHHTEVRHDHWCALLAARGPCNCSPEIVSRSPNRKERRREKRGRKP